MKNKQFAMPDASIILLCVAVIAYFASLFITPGVFNAEKIAIALNYHNIKQPQIIPRQHFLQKVVKLA